MFSTWTINSIKLRTNSTFNFVFYIIKRSKSTTLPTRKKRPDLFMFLRLLLLLLSGEFNFFSDLFQSSFLTLTKDLIMITVSLKHTMFPWKAETFIFFGIVITLFSRVFSNFDHGERKSGWERGRRKAHRVTKTGSNAVVSAHIHGRDHHRPRR